MKPSSTILKTAVALAAALWLSGCKLPAPDAEADAGARKAYEQVAANDLTGLQAHAGPEMKGPDAARNLAALRQVVPPGKPPEGMLVGWNISTNMGVGTTNVLTYDYIYPSRTVRARVTLFREKKSMPWQLRNVSLGVLGSSAPPAGPAPRPDTKDI